MSYTKCAYYNCDRTSKDISMFRFPVHDDGRMILWIRNSGNIYLDSLTSAELSHHYICAAHFKPVNIHHGYQRSRLLGPAIPIHFQSRDTEMNSNAQTTQNMEIDEPFSPEILKVKTPVKFYSKKCRTSHLERENSSPSTSSMYTGPPAEDTPPQRFSRRCLFEKPKARLSRKCLFQKQSNDSPKTKKLKYLAASLLRKNRALQAQVKRLRAKSIYIKKEDNYRSEVSKILVQMQQRRKHCKNKWTKEERKFCLSLFYKSPSTYFFLRRQGVVLAAPSTIRRWLSKSCCFPGLESLVFGQIKNRFQHSTLKEKACVVCFDEMTIMQNLEYSKKYDVIEGFEDLGKGYRTKKVAKSALVFIARGLYSNWKLPVAYFLTNTNMKAENLRLFLCSLLNKLFESGLLPKAVVCDQASTNQKLYKTLGVSNKSPFFFNNERKYFALFDVPHLIKNIRNNLLNNNFLLDDKEISFEDIEQCFKIDQSSSKSRTLLKITERHIHPNAFQKMNVSLATQIFSNAVSDAITTSKGTGQLNSQTAINTAKFIKIVNNLFDGLNSKSQYNINPHKWAFSQHSRYVMESIITGRNTFEKLKKITIKKNKNEILEQILTRPPCFDGVVQSCEALLQMYAEESTDNISYIITNKLNQDVIENLFSRFRQKGGSNRNPTAKSLRTIFRSNLINSLIKLPTNKNCEDEDDEFVEPAAMGPLDTISPLRSNCDTHADSVEMPSTSSAGTSHALFTKTIGLQPVDQSAVQTTSTTLEDCSVTYFAGYLAKAYLKQVKCENCSKKLTKDIDINDNSQMLILNKSYGFNKSLKLKMPSDNLAKLVNLAIDSYNLHFKNIMFKNMLKTRLSQLIMSHLKCEAKEILENVCKEHDYTQFIVNQLIIVKNNFFCKTQKHTAMQKNNPKLRILKNK